MIEIGHATVIPLCKGRGKGQHPGWDGRCGTLSVSGEADPGDECAGAAVEDCGSYSLDAGRCAKLTLLLPVIGILEKWQQEDQNLFKSQ
jgi:hypothetical protein